MENICHNRSLPRSDVNPVGQVISTLRAGICVEGNAQIGARPTALRVACARKLFRPVAHGKGERVERRGLRLLSVAAGTIGTGVRNLSVSDPAGSREERRK